MKSLNTKKIIIVSHCVINSNSKVQSFYNTSKRESIRKELVKNIIQNDIGIIQLPCPEFIMYGAKRWGHVKDQFDNTHFRQVCKKELESIVYQIKDYIKNGYEIISILGIDGSPSCGVNLTCTGNWGGEISNNPIFENLSESIIYKPEKGILIEELEKLLVENNISIEMIGFSENNIDKIYEIIS